MKAVQCDCVHVRRRAAHSSAVQDEHWTHHSGCRVYMKHRNTGKVERDGRLRWRLLRHGCLVSEMVIHSVAVSFTGAPAGYATYRPGDTVHGVMTLIIGGNEPHKLSCK